MKSLDRLSDQELELVREAPSHCEIAAWQKDAEIRSRYGRGGIGLVWKLEPLLVNYVLGDLRGELSRINNFALRTRTKVRNRKILHFAKMMKDLSPNLIYEFGAGASTIVLGLLLRDRYQKTGQSGRLVSFEQSPEYHKLLVSNMPRELLDFVEIRLLPVRLLRMGNYRALYYDVDQYDPVVDFAYVDGPARMSVAEQGVNCPNFSGDIVRMVQTGVQLRAAATDVRWFNYSFFTDFLSDRFSIEVSMRFKSILLTERAAP